MGFTMCQASGLPKVVFQNRIEWNRMELNRIIQVYSSLAYSVLGNPGATEGSFPELVHEFPMCQIPNKQWRTWKITLDNVEDMRRPPQCARPKLKEGRGR